MPIRGEDTKRNLKHVKERSLRSAQSRLRSCAKTKSCLRLASLGFIWRRQGTCGFYWPPVYPAVSQLNPTEFCDPKSPRKGHFRRQSVGPAKVCFNWDKHATTGQPLTDLTSPPLACFKFRFVSSPPHASNKTDEELPRLGFLLRRLHLLACVANRLGALVRSTSAVLSGLHRP